MRRFVVHPLKIMRLARRDSIWIGVALLVSIFATACGGRAQFHGTAYDPPRPAPPIPGIAGNGQPFDLATLRGKVTLLFFGFTHCPDACPMTMAELRQMHEQLGDQGQNVAVVFVSTDPERDTPERLGRYVSLFNPDFLGVHVAAAELPAVKQAYGVYSEINTSAPQGSTEGYLIDHSGYIYVIDKAGQLRIAFGYSLPKDELLADVQALLR